MKRRSFLVGAGATAGAAAFAWPLSGLAQQQTKIARIGFLGTDSQRSFTDSGRYGAFLQGMRELGYAEGKNFVMEARFADNRPERLPGMAAELVRMNVAVIVIAGSDAARSAQLATTNVPIVLAAASDPIKGGLAASLARPGGNITGMSMVTTDLIPKQMELLKEISPKISRAGILVNPANASHAEVLGNALRSAQKFGLTVVPIDARTPEEIERGFANMSRERVDAVIVPTDVLFFAQRKNIANLAVKYRVASAFPYAESVIAGGLMSYGAPLNEFYRRAARYVVEILKGAKPGDLPIEQPTTFEFVLNRRVAIALGLAVSDSLLLRANRVVE